MAIEELGTDTQHYYNLSYTYPVERLWSGASFGNMACFARTDRASNLDGFWLAAENEWLCGRLDLLLEVDGRPAQPVSTLFYPGHQQTTFVADGLEAEQTIFIPYGEQAGPGAAVYLALRLLASQAIRVRLTCDVRWPAVASRNQTKQPERHHVQRRVRQWLEPGLLWAQTAPFRVDRWATTLGDANEIRALRVPDGATATVSEPGRARLVYDLQLTAGEELILPFTLLAGRQGEAELRLLLRDLPDWISALAATVHAYQQVLSSTLLFTPDPLINRGMQWAKANTVRVQHRYRRGVGFTNDPPQDIVVVRDCAWYGLGADWLTPGFVADMYDLLLDCGIEDGGKLTEYLHADTGQREDYALNINDDTPLFVVGAYHHYLVSGDSRFINRLYPALRDACAWILAQRREGLVWCTAEGSDVWGNATWRNIIPGYHLAGAVTEINALCYWALIVAAQLAAQIDRHDDADLWRSSAAELRQAMDERLIAADGYYLLNRDQDGENPGRTADLIFPLLAAAAGEERARRILDLLYGATFYTPYGIHTVARDQAEYHPSFGHGLMGGLWPNLTAWVAYAGRARYPDRLAAMMHSVYALSEPQNPAAGGHLVPGEFPEWFDGASFASLGMAMSPWMPPTYIWLGVEGLAGIAARPAGLAANPNLPPDWRWLVLRNLPYRGERLSLFVCDRRLYSTRHIESDLPQELFSRDISAELVLGAGVIAVALEGAAGVTVLVGATEAVSSSVTLRGERRDIALQRGEGRLLRWGASA